MATYQVRSKIFSVKSTTTVSVEELFQFGVIAQLAERYFCKVKDVGSNPIGSTLRSIGEKVSYLTVTQKSTERYRHRPQHGGWIRLVSGVVS